MQRNKEFGLFTKPSDDGKEEYDYEARVSDNDSDSFLPYDALFRIRQ